VALVAPKRKGCQIFIHTIYQNGDNEINCHKAGLPDGIFSYQNPNLVVTFRPLGRKILVYFMCTVCGWLKKGFADSISRFLWRKGHCESGMIPE
jgi:hypothetical protein